MSLDLKQIHVLHTYYVRASGVFEDYKCAAKTELVPNTGEFGTLISAMEAMNRLSVFYGLLFALIEGFKEYEIRDEALDALFASSEHMDVLRRYRNAIFHFQRDFHESEKVLAMLESETIVPWTKAIWKEMNRWFKDNFVAPLRGQIDPALRELMEKLTAE